MKTVKKDTLTYYAVIQYIAGMYRYSYGGYVLQGSLDLIGATIEYDSGLKLGAIYIDIPDQKTKERVQEWMETLNLIQVVS